MLEPRNYDVVILVSGPPGLQAAIHAARRKASVLLMGKEIKSSLCHAHVENFCCLFNVKGEDVAVVGGASAAVSGALTLLDYAATVHLICNRLEVSMALEKQLKDSAVVVHAGRKVDQTTGRDSVAAVVLKSGSKLPVTGVFIELGAKGVMALATHLGVQLDDQMIYIQTDKKMETNVPGVFAAGDICGPPWQMAKAVGEGCVAGLGAASLLEKETQDFTAEHAASGP